MLKPMQPNPQYLDAIESVWTIPGPIGKIRNSCQIGDGVASSTSKSRALTSYDPPNNGFLGAGRDFIMISGARVDRYGRDAGRFLSPESTPIPMRSLPPGTTTRPYSVFEVTKSFPVKAGEIAPAYGQPGLGTQFVTDRAIRDLISSGYLKRVQP